ncbi:hypothetical protein PVK06_001111 [Gossypium arboreum]|uniref:Uncharacterized protein n=1 Tax=Gossypium arboreum TaxID=29729 RepID=A0ABR0R0B8_GOSAR|nr:hypothetical protein PVK06_001111 [Gossypium arboreum]
MIIVESLVELVPRKDKFEYSMSNGKRNGGGDHKEDKEEHSDDANGNNSNGKSRNRKRRPNNPKEVEANRAKKSVKKLLNCFIYSGPYRMQNCLERVKLSTTSKKE